MPGGNQRINAIDALRGLVMALMVVDHVREFFFLHQQVTDPMDLHTTSPGLFFTRFASHFCAPVFVFLTGLGAWCYGQRHLAAGGDPRRAASAFLAKRGLFLVLLELSLINFAWTFAFPPRMFYLQVIWAIGLSMLALAALLWLPRAGQLVLGLLIIVGHNLLDGLHFPPGTAAHAVWAVLHDRAIIELAPGLAARTSYPVLPWIGVILLGYGLGPWFAQGSAPEQRRRRLALAGLGALVLFVLLRGLGGYGDHPLAGAGTGLATLMDWLNLTKYPPSLLFLLLTLGSGLLGLAVLERHSWNFLAVLGRVPMFFYVVHLYALHLLNLLCLALWGPTQGERYGFGQVWQIWGLALLSVPALYPLCRRFADYKRRHPGGWLSYF